MQKRQKCSSTCSQDVIQKWNFCFSGLEPTTLKCEASCSQFSTVSSQGGFRRKKRFLDSLEEEEEVIEVPMMRLPEVWWILVVSALHLHVWLPLVDWLIDWFSLIDYCWSDWLIDWSIDRVSEWLIDWVSVRLIDWLKLVWSGLDWIGSSEFCFWVTLENI